MPEQAAVVALVGGQYGSEGKGAIAHYLANEFNVHVRSGGPNAGHTFSHMGRKWPMQQVPCGWTNPQAKLVLSAGALVSTEVLEREMRAIASFEVEMQASDLLPARPAIWSRVVVDAGAGIISPKHKEEAGGVDGEAHKRYGSTGEGVGVARMARLERRWDRFYRAFQIGTKDHWFESMVVQDTSKWLNAAAADYSRDGQILLEGTQGAGLSIVHGTWPYTTNHDTGAAQMLADAGIAPSRLTNTIMVFRTFPIRVAGNSGPLAGELSWEEMARITNEPGLVEFTTVTKKPRRIGQWDLDLAERAVWLNNPDGLALTFLDYMFPGCKGITTWDELCTKMPEAADWVCSLELQLGVRVWFVGTGPDMIIDRRPSITKPAHWQRHLWYSDLVRQGRLTIPAPG